MKKPELVIIPTPGMGHLVSTVELAKRMLNQNCGFSITILVIKPLFGSVNHSESLAASDARIRYMDLPHVDPPPPPELMTCPEPYISAFVESHKPHVIDAINKLVSPSVQLIGLVVDMFCTSMIDVAHQLGVPSYLYCTSGASALGFVLYLPTRVGGEFKQSDPDSIVPSFINPVPSSVLPSFAFDKDGYSTFSGHARRFLETNGIIINTVSELESHAVNYLLNEQMPPIYTVGPLLDLNKLGHPQSNQADRDKIMKWLDDQPPKSVVFLCFGSMGSFGVPQVKEIAIGLERSGQRFLWSLRQPDKVLAPTDYTNYEEILPPGFLNRTDGRGMLCGWAPQVEVLAHPSVGAFVSHCGWNSILESIWYGVPIIAWPIYAEQQINAFEMVRELRLAVEVKLDYRYGDDPVVADDIERGIRCMMEGDGEARKRTEEISEKCRMGVMESGSSFASLERLIKNILAGK